MSDPVTQRASTSASLAPLPQGLPEWQGLITEAIQYPDPIESNYRITRAHHKLGRGLAAAIGGDAGANFHYWAVWGSRKAGATVRQEDLGRARKDATVVAGICGLATGAGISAAMLPGLLLAPSAVVGLVCGALTGRRIADWSRQRASEMVLLGNRVVIEDIGMKSAAYIAAVATGDQGEVDRMLKDFRPGDTATGGQDLLAEAFSRYELARHEADTKRRHEHVFFANCLAVLHEHIRLDPIIRTSMPIIVRKCVTKRLMTFDIGSNRFAVSEPVPSHGETQFPPTLSSFDDPRIRQFLFSETGMGWALEVDRAHKTAAKDWTRLRERMGYVFQLFRARHLDPEVTSDPGV